MLARQRFYMCQDQCGEFLVICREIRKKIMGSWEERLSMLAALDVGEPRFSCEISIFKGDSYCLAFLRDFCFSCYLCRNLKFCQL